MFESIRMPARSVSRISLCALAVAAWALIGGFHPGSASAACTGTIEGQGSLLQKIPQQEIWTTGYVGGGCSGGKAEPKYTSSESSTGLLAWGFLGSIERSWSFIGTDVGPSAAQIANAKAAAGAGSHVVVVPVAQTAIAVIVHPPTGCTLANITNVHLEEAFSGAAESWAAIGAVKTGTTEACPGTSNLTRVVRKDDSGTTYQFKNYLAQVNQLRNSPGGEMAVCPGQAKWSALETFGYSDTPNTEWPECGTIAVERPIGTGGGEEAKKVAETSGTIGYAALPDAKAKGATTAKVQENGISGSPSYAVPTRGTEEANCVGAEYTVPAEGNTSLSGTGVDVDWSQVFGGNPSIGGETYPICALTYDLAWQNYETAGFGAAVGTDVKHYYEYIVKEGTGGMTVKKWYSNLPAKTGSSEEHNVKMAAEFAIGKISSSASCSGTIEGQGSSLQKIPQQEIWTTGWNSSGCGVGTHAEAKYTSSESPTGLLEWGFLGAIERKWAFIGTDDGPSVPQIANAKDAAGAGSHVVVVPVAQTAIAVLVHPPANCAFAVEEGLTNAHLEEAFSGKAETWAAIGAKGEGCGKSLTRVVRKDASGTTYQFKNYLAQINKLRNTGTEAEICPPVSSKKWSELEEIPTKNTEWPECGTIAVERPIGTGGGEEARKVAETAGTIGYAILPDAKAKGASTVEVQNNGISAPPRYVTPNKGTEEARCGEAEYTVPAGANTSLSGAGVDVDWSQVFGGNPSAGVTVYPICMLTYDLAWQNYETAGFGAGETVGASVKAYYEYIVKEGTGAMTVKKWYSNLPAKTGSSEEHNVKMAAEFSLGKIVK